MNADARSERKQAEAPALDRGLAILELLAEASEPLGFNRINSAVALNPSSTARLLRTLLTRGYAAKTEDGRYRLGETARKHFGAPDPPAAFRCAAEPVVEALRDQSGNSAIAFWWSGSHALSVAKATHEQAPAMQPLGRIGRDLFGGPWFSVALARLDAQACTVLARAYGVGKTKALHEARRARRELARWGCVFDDGGAQTRVRRIATPVIGPGDALIGMLCLGGTHGTMPDDRLDDTAALLRHHAFTLSRSLGGEPPAPTD